MKTKFAVGLTTALLTACGGQSVAPKPVAPMTQAVVPPSPEAVQTKVVPLPSVQKRPFFNESSVAVAQGGYLANANVQNFIDHELKMGKLYPDELKQFFAQVQHKNSLIRTMDRPATAKPWYEFRAGNSGAVKINGGKHFYQKHKIVIDEVARRYGVPAGIVVAIVGIETNYGANMGNVRVADSLATLAFDYPRRGEFFQNELSEFLLLAKEEQRNPFSFVGSFAGAMGMPQFMPSSYRKWAVDFDGDGKRNIWSSIPDVVASVANYMKAHGWQTGGRILIPATLTPDPKLVAIMEEKTALNYTVGQLRQMGVTPLAAVGDDEKAMLYRLEVAPNRYEYFLGLNNFYVVWQYNHSRMYVTAVHEIATGVMR